MSGLFHVMLLLGGGWISQIVQTNQVFTYNPTPSLFGTIVYLTCFPPVINLMEKRRHSPFKIRHTDVSEQRCLEKKANEKSALWSRCNNLILTMFGGGSRNNRPIRPMSEHVTETDLAHSQGRLKRLNQPCADQFSPDASQTHGCKIMRRCTGGRRAEG